MDSYSSLSPRGGRTVAQIIRPAEHPDEGPEILAEGQAVCNLSDNFCKRLGRTIALGRALRDLETDLACPVDPIVAQVVGTTLESQP